MFSDTINALIETITTVKEQLVIDEAAFEKADPGFAKIVAWGQKSRTAITLRETKLRLADEVIKFKTELKS